MIIYKILEKDLMKYKLIGLSSQAECNQVNALFKKEGWKFPDNRDELIFKDKYNINFEVNYNINFEVSYWNYSTLNGENIKEIDYPSTKQCLLVDLLNSFEEDNN